MSAVPKGGRVRIVKDAASPLFALVCALPCGERGCENRGGHPGLPGLRPEHWGVCWLGSSDSAHGARRIAERCGWKTAS